MLQRLLSSAAGCHSHHIVRSMLFLFLMRRKCQIPYLPLRHMSDTHSNQIQSLQEINRQENESDINEIDADSPTSSPEHHQQHELHDGRYWHTVCRVRDCKLGFPECKLGSSCCKAGWKNALEEPLLRSRSLATGSKRPGSVTMLPSLLSNLTVSRTRSDPCIFGKDFLRITLPLPGEPSGCEAKGHAVENLKCSVVENMDEPMNLVGTGTAENNPVLEFSTSPFILPCKSILPKTSVNSENDRLFGLQYTFAHTDGDDESVHNITSPRIDDSKEHRTQVPDTASLRNDMDFSKSSGVIFSEETMGNLGDTFFDENAAANNPKEGVNNSFRNSRTPQWVDWWTCQPNECSQRNKYPVQRRMQYRNKSKEHYLTVEETEMDQAEEEGVDEGYLVLEEHGDQQLGREEESMLNAKQDINNDYWEEELIKEKEINTDSSSKGYKEDDIWSDEHFVSSQVKGFPPPISILANETHPGLPGHMPRTLWRSVKRDGRFVLQEVQAQPREFFRATRECGRLRLQLVRPDSDPVGSYMEIVSKEDSDRTVSVACPSSIENIAGILDTVRLEDSGIVNKIDMSGTPTQEFDVPQPEDSWTPAKSGAALDKDDPKLVGGLMPSTSSPKDCGSVIEGETSGPCFGKKCTEMFGIGFSADVGLKEVPDSTGRDVLIEISCVANHSQISEESWRGKLALDEMLSRTTHHIIAYESQYQNLEEKEVGRVREMVEVDNREKPVGLCPSDVEVGIPLDTGAKRNVGQIDGERKMERMGVVDLCTKLNVGQVEEVEDLGIGNHSNVVMSPTVHGHEEQFMQDYQHPCFNSTYGFDNNLKVLSPSQAFMQFPIQPAVR